LLEALDALLIELEAGLAQEHVGKQSAAHADLAMDSPDRKIDAFGLERFAPREHVLIDAVDQRAVEIEEKCGLLTFCLAADVLETGGWHASDFPMRWTRSTPRGGRTCDRTPIQRTFS
jgi:hypothetical protein